MCWTLKKNFLLLLRVKAVGWGIHFKKEREGGENHKFFGSTEYAHAQ